MDQFTLVAAYDDTVVTVHSNPVQTITLSSSGESYHLSLPASAFHRLRGRKPFHVYAKYSLSGQNHPTGLCTVPGFPLRLFKCSYRFTLVEPLRMMESVYIVIIVSKKSEGQVMLVSEDESTQTVFNMCDDIKGNAKSLKWKGI
ncbi:hypothetical protein PoB_003329700 [Plakobranchus ocellatus]|uniref:Uncharacterized protein n=1 Tax=Plakobranchus ocellatus TaxID=259542 RepID=A0AAV4AIS0_9GAST|nr:hypothetical protein PoB_003329700 [Plakobranchus ocellatus]